ncbi:MAG: peroxiredoxin-like family protein [Pirellulaceae bacterium]|jgi:peroxiredoxin|nr:peroxiredoxin-like family protein [Pirellulaceae bacterium]MDP7016752.1 peroxiredoxin-like family protein [Pirellulaceae bacterium]
MGLQIGDEAPGLPLMDEDGERRSTPELWSDGPVVLLFTRHLGCAFCRDQLGQAKRHNAEVEAAGARIAAVTMAPPSTLSDVRASRELPFSLYSDVDQQVYAAFGAPRGSLNQVAGPAVWGAGASALARCGVGRPRGDLRQLQSTFVVDRNGRIQFVNYPRTSAEQVDYTEVMAALAGLQDQ